MTELQLAQLVAKRVNGEETYADADADLVDGVLSEVIAAVLEVVDQHGPVVLGD
ncbi:MAG TPA: hypothetical protein VI172_08230 [Candidatus Dormibacteraeota bacterium]